MSQDHHLNSNAPSGTLPAFDVDGMLGALAKWLRILGFDAAYPCSTASPGRIFVTTKRIAGSSDTVIVEDQDPLVQLQQVLEESAISPDPELFLSRCLVCNAPVEQVPREKVTGRVPEQVLQKVAVFNECPKCGRVYWEGSHAERMKRRLHKTGISFKV